ncbi:MAG TPA: PQQ-dependent sugar dehydrogenase, partial [Myxococcota bacterium]|nr:PQQ-dependent sugar dehydrogenase [Myxococcota bacterium]
MHLPRQTRVAALAFIVAACGNSVVANNNGGGDVDADADGAGLGDQGSDDGDGAGDGDSAEPTALTRYVNTSCDLSGPAATPVFAGLSPFQLTYMAAVPGITGYLVVSEQRGRVMVFPRDDYQAGDEHEVLDLTDRVFNNDEKGFHSFAFAPDFGSTGGYLYVMYSIDAPAVANDQDSRVERYTCTRDLVLTCDPDSGRTVIEIQRPDDRGNHNGGQIFFDDDDYLYITMGDSGGGGDPDDWAQDLSRLQGKILRIDPSQDDGPLHYTVPADNPFVGVVGAAPEIWAYGLRNPWRASYDPVSDRIFLADVGQDQWEEVDIIEPGNNYGWNLREGLHQYYGTCPTCTEPIHEYEHTMGCVSITGGFVYRGGQIGSLYGAYVFADYLTGEVFRLDEDMGGTWTANRFMTTGAPITSFGTDDLGELYALHNDGTIHRIQLDETDTAPPTLTDTGCYSDVPGRTPIAAAVPYDLRVPFWS